MSELNISTEYLPLDVDHLNDGEDELVKLDAESLKHYPLTGFYTMVAEERGLSGPEEAAVHLLNHTAYVRVLAGKDKSNPLHYEQVKWIPSGRMGRGQRKPHLGAEIMICGKVPGSEEIRESKVMVGPTGELIEKVASRVEENGINLWKDLLVKAFGTNLLRFMPRDRGKNLRKEHVADCLPLLVQEIAFLKPKYILVMGMDALKVFLGNKMTLAKSRSRCFLLMEPHNLGKVIPAEDATDEQYDRGIKLFVTIHPAAAARETGLEPGLEADFRSFLGLYLRGQKSSPLDTFKDVQYRYADSFAGLLDVAIEVAEYFRDHPEAPHELAVDCEWGGGTFLSGKLRTIQFSWAPKHACVVILRRKGLVDAQPEEERDRMIALVKDLFLGEGEYFPGLTDMKVFGHNIRADMLWLERIGIDLSKVDGIHTGRVCFDTMLADHILSENTEHGLDACALRYTNMGRYDLVLNKWLEANKPVDDRGFADVPDEILHFYAACDPDATFRIKVEQVKRFARLRLDPVLGGEIAQFGKMDLQALARARQEADRIPLRERKNPENCFREIVIPCVYPINEIERNGILPDEGRMAEFVEVFARKKDELQSKIRALVGNVGFNVRSIIQVRTLFYSARDPIQDEQGKVIGWRGLGYTPFKTTEKPTRIWADVQESELALVNPSTDAESLEWLASEHIGKEGVEIVEAISDFRSIDQIVKNFLHASEETGEYEKGMLSAIIEDGKIHTRISQMSETGRWKSSAPNMQNIPKKTVKDLEAILGDKDAYAAHIRSCFLSSPGFVYVEADYKSAEIYSLGFLAACPDLVRDAVADLHARGAVNYFGAKKWDGFNEYRTPPKEWLDEYKSLRVSAKSVNFGIPYQRGAKAVAREIIKSTQGKIMCTPEQAQRFIDGFYQTYPAIHNYVEMCKTSVMFPKWLDNPFGRRRRFSWGSDKSRNAAQQREAVNFPIQSTVAELLNRASYLLWLAHSVYPELKFRIVLGIHDALILEVPGEEVPFIVDELLPCCMSELDEVPPWLPEVFHLRASRDGKDEAPDYESPFYKVPTSPFKLDIDVELAVRWGEKASLAELMERGVDKAWLEKRGMGDR